MMSTGRVVLQPYMVERHPAYRAQLDILRELSPSITVNAVFPDDDVEHERWAPRYSGIRRVVRYAAAQMHAYRLSRQRIDRHYVVGDFAPRMHFLLSTPRVHVDADDPLNLYAGIGRGQVDGAHCRRVALKLLAAMRAGTLTLSFWTEAQLRNFAATLHPSEAVPLLERGALRAIPPCIQTWPVQAQIGRSEALRCLMIATGGKFWHKGVADAMTAVHRVKQRGHAVSLTVVADSVPDAWREFASRHAYYRLVGRLARAELDALFLQHDVVVFPSHHDSYGWVIVEGKARGLPAIATDFYTRPEIVRHGEDGLLIADPFNNPFLPIAPLAYAEGFMTPDGSGGISVSPLIEPYVESLVDALARCHHDRVLLRSMGQQAYLSTAADGRFGRAARLAVLRELLLVPATRGT